MYVSTMRTFICDLDKIHNQKYHYLVIMVTDLCIPLNYVRAAPSITTESHDYAPHFVHVRIGQNRGRAYTQDHYISV